MAKSKSVTAQIINIDTFHTIAGYIDDTSAWLSDVRERENIFDKMRDDGRLWSLVEERKGKVLMMYGSLTPTGNKTVDEACEKYLTFNIFYQLNNILLNAVPLGLSACENLWELKEGLYVPKGFVPIPRQALSFTNSGSDFYTPHLTSLNIPLDDPAKWSVHRNDDGTLTQWGRPALRSAYVFWKFKQLGVRFWATAAQKIGSPTILALFEAKGETEAQRRAQDLVSMMQDWEGGSSGAMGNVKSIEVVSSAINDFAAIIETCNAEIAYAITAQSLSTNQAQYGTRAQSDTHTQTFDAMIKRDAYAVQQADQRLVDAFVRINFPGQTPPSYDIDSSDFADWTVIRDAVNLGIPVSLSSLYKKVHLPKPENERDAFVRQDTQFDNSFFLPTGRS